jgi:eukaryotic-like serine/threonine-protein kinase
MEPDRLHQIEELYHAALELEGNRRADFLREACGTDESLRREVESLLAYRSQAEDFIELPAMEVAAGALARDEVRQRQTTETERDGGVGTAPWMPAHIGRYRVLRLLGEGGMGVVYEAEQEQPRRIVALKVIKPGLASADVLRRFAQESEALARLQHLALRRSTRRGPRIPASGRSRTSPWNSFAATPCATMPKSID